MKTKEFINDENVFKQTPLIVAAKNGFDEVFNILINNEGIQINKQDIKGINFIVFNQTAFLNVISNYSDYKKIRKYKNIFNSLLSNNNNDINIVDDELI